MLGGLDGLPTVAKHKGSFAGRSELELWWLSWALGCRVYLSSKLRSKVQGSKLPCKIGGPQYRPPKYYNPYYMDPQSSRLACRG